MRHPTAPPCQCPACRPFPDLDNDLPGPALVAVLLLAMVTIGIVAAALLGMIQGV